MADLERRAAKLLGEANPPAVLWVANSPLTDAMTMPHVGDPLDVGDHFDWLLAAGDTQLGLIRMEPGRPLVKDVVLTFDYESVRLDVQDHGELERRRVFLLTFDDDRWIALGARIKGRRHAALDAFTELLRSRCRS